MPSPAASFDEIRAVAQSLPDMAFAGLGVINHPRIVLYAATHGIADLVPGGSAAAMIASVDDLVGGKNALHHLVALADADLKLYDLALDRPTRDSRHIQAIDEIEAARAAAYGMMAVEPGIDIFVTAALGVGAELAGLALARALLPGDAPAGDMAVIGPALDRHGELDDPLELLAALGGPDIAAMLGVILAGRLAGVPVILDGIAAFAAAAVAWRLRPDALAHCRFAVAEVAGFPVGLLGLEAVLAGADDAPLTGGAGSDRGEGLNAPELFQHWFDCTVLNNQGTNAMNRIVPILISGVTLISISACTHQSTVLDKAPGTYETKTSATTSNGTDVSSKQTTTVGYDANGNKEAVVKTKNTVDPPGLFNKSTTTSTETVK